MKRSIILAALAALASTGLACAAPNDVVLAPAVPVDVVGVSAPIPAAPAPAAVARPLQLAEQPAAPQTTVLILPFAQQAGEPDSAWVGATMGDHMRTELGEAGFKVVPLAEGTPAVGSAEEALRIARAAGAQAVVYGTYQVVGDTVRVQGQVLDVATGLPRSDVRAGGAVRDLFVTEDMLMAQIDQAIRAPAPAAAADGPAAGDEPVVMAEVIRPEQVAAATPADAVAPPPGTATAPYDDQMAATEPAPAEPAYVDPGPVYVDPPMGDVEPYPPYVEGDWYPGTVVYPPTYVYPYYPAYSTWSGLSFSFGYSSGYCWPRYGHGHYHGYRYDHGRYDHGRYDRHDDHWTDRHNGPRHGGDDDRGPRFRENYENYYRYYDRDGNPRRDSALVRGDGRDRGTTFRDVSARQASSRDDARAREARTTTSLLGSRSSSVASDRANPTDRADLTARSERSDRPSFRDSRSQVTRIEPAPTRSAAASAPTRSASPSVSERTSSATTSGRSSSSFRSERSRPEPTASPTRSAPTASSPPPARSAPPAAASSSSTRFRESSARPSSSSGSRAGSESARTSSSSSSVRSAAPAARSMPPAPTVSRRSDSGSSSSAARSSSSSGGGDRFRSSSSSVRSAPPSSDRSAASARSSSSSSSSSSRSSGSSSSRGGGSSSSSGRSSRR